MLSDSATVKRPVIQFKSVIKDYPGSPAIRALNEVSFELGSGAFAAVIGPSGSGKSSLLNIASGLDKASQGEVQVAGVDLMRCSVADLSQFRRFKIGFVFQAYNLFPVLTVLENIEYTSIVRGDDKAQVRERAKYYLDKVGLSDRGGAFPAQLSGGQQQRVAVARALASAPEIIFADEPTANLDSKTATSLIDLFEALNVDEKVSFLFSTHDTRLVERVRVKLEMMDGKLS